MRRTLSAAVILAAFAAIAPALRGQSPPSFLFTPADLEVLVQCEALDRQLESRALVYHDAAIESHLTDLAAPLLPRTAMEHVTWRFHVLRDPDVNAFSLPNGSIYVSSGLLARAENDDELVGVLGHEVMHVIHRHAYLFHRSVRKRTVESEAISVVTGVLPVGGWVLTAVSDASRLAIVSMIYGYSRRLEEDADREAIDRVRQSGRDAAQTLRLFEIMGRPLEPQPVPLFLNAHPGIQDRIAHLKTILEAGDVTPGPDAGYLDRMRPAILQNIRLDLDSRRFRSAVAGAGRLAAARPGDPVALYWLGESYRALGPRRPLLSEKEMTEAGQRSAYRKSSKRTETEETARLAKTEEGREMLAANQRKAEELFRKAAAIDPAQPETYLGLGTLYQEQGKRAEAIEAYRKYIALAKQPGEKLRARRRIEALEKEPPQ